MFAFSIIGIRRHIQKLKQSKSYKSQAVIFGAIIIKAQDGAKGTLRGIAIQIIKEAAEVGDCNVSA